MSEGGTYRASHHVIKIDEDPVQLPGQSLHVAAELRDSIAELCNAVAKLSNDDELLAECRIVAL